MSLASLWPLQATAAAAAAAGRWSKSHATETFFRRRSESSLADSAQHFFPLVLPQQISNSRHACDSWISSDHSVLRVHVFHERCPLYPHARVVQFYQRKKNIYISRLTESVLRGNFLHPGLPFSTNNLFWDSETRWPQGQTSSPPRTSRGTVTLTLCVSCRFVPFLARRAASWP